MVLADLRVRIFREFPYLYDGTVEDECSNLRAYANSANSLITVMYDGIRHIAAMSCLPMQDAWGELVDNLSTQAVNISECLYIGEILMEKTHRGMGLGSRLFDFARMHAVRLNMKKLCFFSVRRDHTHDARPADYLEPAELWQKWGFSLVPGADVTLSYPQVDVGMQSHILDFWIRPLNGTTK